MAALLRVKKYLLLTAVCLLLICVRGVSGESEDASITYTFRTVQISDTQPPLNQQAACDKIPEIVRMAYYFDNTTI